MLKFIRSFVAAFVIGAFASVVLGGINVVPATAHDDPKPHTHAKEANTSKSEPAGYVYTAQQGDSYSQLARKAVQTYGKTKKVNLSQAQIIFAETTLTQAAHSPLLNLGDRYTIAESAVKDAVEKAGKLSVAQIAAWNLYVQGVNFNTDKVGQAK